MRTMLVARKLLTTAVLLVMYAVIVTPYPNGAPDSACISLFPDTHGPSTAIGPSPYNVTPASFTYSPNQDIEIVLSGEGYFKGYLIVGRRADNATQNPVGFFHDPYSGAKLACSGFTDGNGITHTSNNVKSSYSFQWRAPNASVGNITFHYTVVRSGAPGIIANATDYFSGQISAPIAPVAFDKFEEINKGNASPRISETNTNFEKQPFEKLIYRAKSYQHDKYIIADGNKAIK